MYLHNNQSLFKELVSLSSRGLGIPDYMVEKDYYVTLFLKKISEVEPNIIFKGGTSLSKCFKVINRFSEDIDLNINSKDKPTEGQRRNLKDSIINIINQQGFNLSNPEAIRSRRDFNRYEIDYKSIFESSYIKQSLVVETAVFFRSYPFEYLSAQSLIAEYLNDNHFSSVIDEYLLYPFSLNVQSMSRTFVDKTFAICDYYLSNRIEGHSRHIYDLYMLLKKIDLNESIRELVAEVRAERKTGKTCLSAQDNVSINNVLKEIISTQVFKNDYQHLTIQLLYDSIPYNTAISALSDIIECHMFDSSAVAPIAPPDKPFKKRKDDLSL